jgi:pimeloyl-ACP methyl ester carboxylesterase
MHRLGLIRNGLFAGVAAALLHVVTAGAAFQEPGGRVALHDCTVPFLDETVRCGIFTVYENRQTNRGRTIALNIVVLPATGASPAHDPVFWLHGGPGAPATTTAPAAKGNFLEGLRRDRDLVFVDQRGTGESNGLPCDIGDDPADLPVFFGALFPPEKVLQCRAELEKRADLRLYTTPIAMDDLDDVRQALGYDSINLVAASYGTIAAQAYLRQHGDHVRSVFLIGVATPGIKQPLLFARAAQHALDRLFEDCAADATCRQAFPNLKAEFEAVLGKFRGGSLRVDLIDPTTKGHRQVVVSRDNYVERLRLLLYTTTFARFVPFIVHAAYGADFVPFETMSIRYNPGSLLARGMYLTVTCSEGVPFITGREIVQEARDTFVGENRVRAHVAACQQWPHDIVPKSFIDPVKSAKPVLMIAGDVDGSSPPWFAENAVQYLSHGREIGVRYLGHQIDNPCIWQLLDGFVAAASAEGLNAGCTADIRRPPFATEIPPQLALER